MRYWQNCGFHGFDAMRPSDLFVPMMMKMVVTPKCGDESQLRSRTFPRLLPGFTWQRRKARDGPAHFGTQDRSDHLDRLEERSAFRRGTANKTSSSLNVSDPFPSN